jgi:sugar (pentulose or hexulose) kinase
VLLGLDLGTTNIKAVLTDMDGAVLARGAAPVHLLHIGEAGVEQDSAEIWQATLSAIVQVGAGRDLDGVRAVGVSSQGAALQMLDGQERPLGQVLSWLDVRGQAQGQRLTDALGGAWFARHTGHGESGISVGQLLWLRQAAPETLMPDARVSFVGDLVVGLLTGERAHDTTSLSITGLYDPYTGHAAAELLAHLGLVDSQLPRVCSARVPAGGLRPVVAERTGLRAGIPVSPAVHDQYAATLGTGAVHAGDVNVGTGTAWVLLAAGERMVLPVATGAYACRHLVEGLSGQMLPLGNGGSAFAWALQLLGMSALSPADVDTLLDSVPTGCDGVRCWPFFSPWVPPSLACNPAARLTGLNLGHGPAHVLRAVLEGMAVELARNLATLAPLGPVGRLVMTGRAAASRVTPQLVADACGLPVACSPERDTSALGAVVIARGLLEPNESLAALSGKLTPAPRKVEPGPAGPLLREILGEFEGALPWAPRSA